MQLVNYLDLFFASLLIMLFCKKIIMIVFKIKESNNNMKKLLFSIICAISILIINLFVKNMFKVLLTLPFTALFLKVYFNEDYIKSILYAMIATFYVFVGEFVLSTVYCILSLDFSFVVNNIFGGTIGTLLSIMFTIPFIYIKKLNAIVSNFINNISIKLIPTNISIILIELFMGALAYKMTMETQTTNSIIMNLIIMLVVGVILYILYLEYKKEEQISDNYNVLLTYLEKYEKELIEKRKIVHDYKNQIIIIKGYMNNPKKLNEYINEIICEQKNINENEIIKNIDKLPKGIKGLIYYKFFQINEKVEVKMNIKNNLKKFDRLDSKTNKDVLKIIGVLVDNAIDAVLIEKDPYITLDFSIIKNQFIMIIENSCTKFIKLKNLMDVGYSTKGRNRGYGLALIKDITKLREDINVDLSLSENKFIAVLTINM